MTAKNYEAWEVSESDYPVNGAMEERLKFLLRYAILAPSGPNSQPWRFAINDGSVSVFADLSRALPFVDPSNRTLYMSVGCAIANLTVAGAHFGFDSSVSYFPRGQESDLVAEVQLLPEAGRRPADRQEDLFAQIQRRHTTKDRYENATIEPFILKEIEKSINLPGLYLSYLNDKDARDRMADLVSRAHQIQLSKKEFRHNLGKWLRNNWTAEPDGMRLRPGKYAAPGHQLRYTSILLQPAHWPCRSAREAEGSDKPRPPPASLQPGNGKAHASQPQATS